jgi:hypothetical protein
MELRTKVLLFIAIGYNMFVGFFIGYTHASLVILFFISLDFFLIFYYMWLLLRQNYGLFHFEKEHRDLIMRAREEQKSVK